MPTLLPMGNVTRVTLRKRRNDCGEFVIRAYGADGKRLPDCDYFTDCWDDAEATYKSMLASLECCNDYSI